MSRLLLPLLIVLSLSMTFGCAMKKTPKVDPAAQTTTQESSMTGENDALRGDQNGIVEETMTSAPSSSMTMEPMTPMDTPNLAGLQVVPFAYDEHLLSEEAKDIISNNAAILKPMTNIRFQLVGHCDERGSDQYNIALGERRAEAVRSYLVELGLAAGRMETVSYGEERPLVAGHDESAWMMNRRVEFVLLP